MAIEKVENTLAERDLVADAIEEEIPRSQILSALGGSLLTAMILSSMQTEQAYAATTTLTSYTEDSAIPDTQVKFDGDIAKNITVSFPSQLRFDAQPDADGNMELTSNEITFENQSTREVVIESVTPDIYTDWTLVSNALTSSGSGKLVSLNIETGGETLNLPTNKSEKATSSSTAWTMAIPSYNENLSKITVSASGAMKNVGEGVLSDINYSKFGQVQWKIGLKTTTNQMLDTIASLKSQVETLKSTNQSLISRYDNKVTQLTKIVNENGAIASNGVIGLGSSISSSSKVFYVDTSVGGAGALKYKQSGTWNPGRYVWA